MAPSSSDISRADLRKARAVSFCAPKQPASAPVPPSLAKSPFLLSPDSVFNRDTPLHKFPSQQEEEWLGDTVPLVWRMDSAMARTKPRADSKGTLSSRSVLSSNISPQTDGAVYTTTFPSPVVRPWSSPPFASSFPPTILCAASPNDDYDRR
ncbi:hypothetical protein CONPUDRAFT_150080 [Coniophora puteana RWD-64-598 SS2]|uniref:Uncharacterized protein n=1 Tax=Coniophora puteana (strain RWD-64-598) TaxID=741705 RepID=A0A5M3N1J3_CONPW|nr:uncharacterized protein CONPUDRAFT_150080 [Coniophora puteana RWD-64-598 SS2]EIW85253.1 hypothetical protein CONPUDRAFT_150080 [Coniophora puteana RWD-64-598 SS2]